MNRKEYIEVCNNCYKILQSKWASNSTMAISFLHVIKEHPEYLKKYNISNYKLIFKTIFYALKKTLVYLIYVFVDQFYKRTNWNDNKKKEIIIISHLLKKDHTKDKLDFYFGDLQKKLNQKNITNYKLLINHTNISSNKLNTELITTKNYKNFNNTIMPKYLSFFDEIVFFAEQVKEFFRLRKKITNIKSVKNTLLSRASISVFDIETRFALRLQLQIKKYIKKFKPKFIICTHEGFAWERLVFNSAKSIDPSIKCIGYQHVVLTKLQHAIRTKFKKSYNPDIIWTSGKISYSELRNEKKLKNMKIKNVGSFKYLNKKNIKKEKIKKIVCLVLPEGIIEECIKLFKFSLDCAELMPQTNFIWRLNPFLDFNYVLNKLNFDRQLPKNILFSKNKELEKDIKLCNFALYRGSSAIISALSAGIYPVYLSIKNEIEIDPLHKLNFWKGKVEKPEEFQTLTINFFNEKKYKNYHFKKRALTFSKKIYSSFFENSALKTLKYIR